MTTTTAKSTYERLTAQFPPAAERTVKKGGATLTYIPISEVVNRLNTVLGPGGWSSEVISARRDDRNPDWVIAHVRLTATIDGNLVSRDAVAGQPVKFKKDTDIPVDLGDEFKGACSDALKKAAQQIGVGAYLARNEDLLADEGFYAEPEVDEVTEMWADLLEITAGFEAEQKAAIKKFWASKTDDKMIIENMTPKRLAMLIAEAERLSVGGSFEDAA